MRDFETAARILQIAQIDKPLTTLTCTHFTDDGHQQTTNQITVRVQISEKHYVFAVLHVLSRVVTLQYPSNSPTFPGVF